MSGLLKQLDDDQAVLLLYLGDELDARDRAAVEMRLAAEPRLAMELDRLRVLETTVRGMVGPGDAAQSGPTPADAQAAARQVGRGVTRWHLTQRSAAAQGRAGWRLPQWAYPAAAAALLLVAYLAWWGRTGIPSVAPPTVPLMVQATPEDPFAAESGAEADHSVDQVVANVEEQLALVNGTAQDPAELFGPGW
jgi:anti-sigma factor RsiW